jgi:D-alanine-D-alanine ligase
MKTAATVCVLHNEVPADAGPDEQDVLIQAAEVTAALELLGYAVFRLEAGLDCQAVLSGIQDHNTDIVFNLVESLAGSDSLIHLLPGIFETAGIPFTGSPSAALFLSSSKIIAKRLMAAAGIPTPDCIDLSLPDPPALKPGTYIVKSATEHASIGLEADCIIELNSAQDVLSAQEKFSRRFRSRAFFAEAFIPGREFNLSILGGPVGPEVLAPAEIIFTNFGQNPAIVGYSAKWNEDAPEYGNTQRSFDFTKQDRELLKDLRTTSLACWREFNLRGYARVDFRVDAENRVWVLEINANPCLTADAGFMAAAGRSGYEPHIVIDRILRAAMLP